MTTARQEKPSVPTPDAGETYAIHLPAMTLAQRVAVMRYVAEKDAEIMRLKGLHSVLMDDHQHMTAAFNDTAARLKVESERADYWHNKYAGIAEQPDSPGLDDMPNPDPTKQRMRDEQDAELERMARRPLVNALADEMERKLRKHDNGRGKLGWQDDQPLDLLVRLREEANELEISVRQHVGSAGSKESQAAVLSEAADVANFAMMVADQCGAITAHRAASPPASTDAGEGVGLPSGCTWEECSSWSSLRDSGGTILGDAHGFGYLVIGEEQIGCPGGREQSKQALIAELRTRGVLPAVPAAGDVRGDRLGGGVPESGERVDAGVRRGSRGRRDPCRSQAVRQPSKWRRVMGLDFSILFWAGLAIGGVVGVIVGGLMPWMWPFALALAVLCAALYGASLLIGDAL